MLAHVCVASQQRQQLQHLIIFAVVIQAAVVVLPYLHKDVHYEKLVEHRDLHIVGLILNGCKVNAERIEPHCYLSALVPGGRQCRDILRTERISSVMIVHLLNDNGEVLILRVQLLYLMKTLAIFGVFALDLMLNR